MKKVLLFFVLCVVALGAVAQDTMTAILWDSDEQTNIRNKPSGAVVMTLSAENPYVLNLTTPQNGWWRVLDLWNAADDLDPTILANSDTGEYWIHYSVLVVSTRNYGGQELCLRDAPDEGAGVVFSFTQELMLRPIDIKGDWVKLKMDGSGIEGWIEAEWLCSNPLTNCC